MLRTMLRLAYALGIALAAACGFPTLPAITGGSDGSTTSDAAREAGDARDGATLDGPSGTGVNLVLLAGSLAGSGSADGTGSNAEFASPFGLAVDGAGNIYVADTGNATIRRVTPAGVVTTLAGHAGTVGSANGAGPAALFNSPGAVALDSSGDVYVADSGNCLIRELTSSGIGNVQVTTLAGSATCGTANGSSSAGTGAPAQFGPAQGIAVFQLGGVFVYVTDSSYDTLREIGVAEDDVTTPAGLPGGSGSVDGPGASARFNYPEGAAADGSGHLFLADETNATIREVSLSNPWTVSTLAGTALVRGSMNGTGSAAQFDDPSAVAVDGAGNVYVTDTSNHMIRKITPAGVVTTVAGANDGKPLTLGTNPRFDDPRGIAVSGSDLVISDDNVILLLQGGAL